MGRVRCGWSKNPSAMRPTTSSCIRSRQDPWIRNHTTPTGLPSCFGRHGLTPPAPQLAEHELPLHGCSPAWSRESSGGRPSYRHPGLRVRGGGATPRGWRQRCWHSGCERPRSYSLRGGDKRLQRSGIKVLPTYDVLQSRTPSVPMNMQFSHPEKSAITNFD
jgi:hypothetical protein